MEGTMYTLLFALKGGGRKWFRVEGPFSEQDLLLGKKEALEKKIAEEEGGIYEVNFEREITLPPQTPA